MNFCFILWSLFLSSWFANIKKTSEDIKKPERSLFSDRVFTISWKSFLLFILLIFFLLDSFLTSRCERLVLYWRQNKRKEIQKLTNSFQNQSINWQKASVRVKPSLCVFYRNYHDFSQEHAIRNSEKRQKSFYVSFFSLSLSRVDWIRWDSADYLFTAVGFGFCFFSTTVLLIELFCKTDKKLGLSSVKHEREIELSELKFRLLSYPAPTVCFLFYSYWDRSRPIHIHFPIYSTRSLLRLHISGWNHQSTQSDLALRNASTNEVYSTLNFFLCFFESIEIFKREFLFLSLPLRSSTKTKRNEFIGCMFTNHPIEYYFNDSKHSLDKSISPRNNFTSSCFNVKFMNTNIQRRKKNPTNLFIWKDFLQKDFHIRYEQIGRRTFSNDRMEIFYYGESSIKETSKSIFSW